MEINEKRFYFRGSPKDIDLLKSMARYEKRPAGSLLNWLVSQYAHKTYPDGVPELSTGVTNE